MGYRVRSPRGLQFRRWASTVLKEYLIKGFVMDDERLKNPDGRPDFFDEMLARIRGDVWAGIARALPWAGMRCPFGARIAYADRELVEIERTIQIATAKHNAFLEELGLPSLPGAITKII